MLQCDANNDVGGLDDWKIVCMCRCDDDETMMMIIIMLMVLMIVLLLMVIILMMIIMLMMVSRIGCIGKLNN